MGEHDDERPTRVPRGKRFAIEGGELVRFYPWTSVGSIEKTYAEGGESPGAQAGRAW